MTLTYLDVINAAGGEEHILKVGEDCDNRYFKKPDKHIKEKLVWASYIGLDKQRNLDILDFGTGAGFFPFICKLYGHRCVGTDERGRSNYEPCYSALGIDPSPQLVPTLESLEGKFDCKFDYIVSFRSFVGTRPEVWGVKEWKFFLKDCATHLLKNDNSRVFFSCNSGKKMSPYSAMLDSETSVWGPKELESFFAPYFIKRDKQLGLKGNIFSITKKQIETL